MPVWRFTIGCLVLLSVSRFVVSSAWGAQGVDIDEMIARMSATERQLHNIEVFGEVVGEVPGAQGKWQKRPDILMQVRYMSDGSAGGKARLDIIQMRAPWADSKGSKVTTSESAAYNGESGTVAFLGVNVDGEVLAPSQAEVVGHRPEILSSGTSAYAWGGAFSTYFWHDGAGQSLSAYLASEVKRLRGQPITWDRPEIIAERVHEGDRDLVHLLLAFGLEDRQEWWLDEKRSMSVVRSRDSSSDGIVKCTFEITALTEAAPGIWYPSEATAQLLLHDGLNKVFEVTEDQMRYHYRASKVTANRPDFDVGVFDLRLPAGFLVQDRIRGTVHVVAPAEQSIASQISQLVQGTRTPATEPSGR